MLLIFTTRITYIQGKMRITMKKMYLVPFAAALALSTFTACGDSSTSANKMSKAVECSKGVTSECLVGTWDLVGLANASLNNEILPNFDYAAGPGKLTFSEDGKFEFDLPTVNLAVSPLIDPLDFPVYGDWKIEGNVVKLHALSTALNKTRVEVSPIIVVGATDVKMSFGPGTLWLMENATDETSIRANATEYYSISAK